MSDRYVGGIIKGDGTELTTSRFGTNSGMFTIGQQLNAFQSGTWPSDYDVALQFTDAGSWECPVGVEEISEYLIISGGGGGGGAEGGGGGAGGVRLGTSLPVIPGKTYTVTVGAGGTGSTGRNVRGSNGEPTGFQTEANVRYYVSVGNPGVGNRYYIKTEQTDSAAGNVAAVTQKLYEGSTYVFDQSHPTNSGHPFKFSETPNGTHATPAGSEYTTGVTTNQPSVAAGTPGSAVQIQVSSPAPQLYYYCSVHPNMGGAADTLANVTVNSSGGGGAGAYSNPGTVNSIGHQGGSGGGGGVAHPGGSPYANMVGGNSKTLVSGNGHTNLPISGENTFRSTLIQGFNGGSAQGNGGPQGGAGGGGGGATQDGFEARGHPLTPNQGGNGGNGLSSTISGVSTFYAGGGGGAGIVAPIKSIGGLGGGGDGAAQVNPGTKAQNTGEDGEARTGGGGGGGAWGGSDAANDGDGGDGGSGVLFIKYKNKINNRVFSFNSSTIFKNDIGAKTVDYLIVGGGGAGAAALQPQGVSGGGGGAGGVRQGSGLPLVPGNTYTIQVGAGGAQGDSTTTIGSNGGGSFIQGDINSDSTVRNLGANGGGGGSGPTHGHSGGSGGASHSNFPSVKLGRGLTLTVANGHDQTFVTEGLFQGFEGSHGFSDAATYTVAGGGGGAGAASFVWSPLGPSAPGHPYANGKTAGNGGNAVFNNITGTSTSYGGGGGGGGWNRPGGYVGGGVGGNAGMPGLTIATGRGGGGNGGLPDISKYSFPADYSSPYGLGPLASEKEGQAGDTGTGGGGGGAANIGTTALRGAAGGSGIVVIKITG